VIGGSAWQLASLLLPQMTTVILSIAIARILGPEDFGRQSFIAFVAIATMMLLSNGLSVALTRFSAELLGRREGAAIRPLIRWVTAIQLVGAAAGGLALVAAGALGADPSAAWELAGLRTALAMMQSVPNALLLGAQRFKQAGLIGLVTNLIAVPSTIAVVALGGGIVGIFAVEAAVAAINLGWTTLVARGTLRGVAPRSGEAAWRSQAPMLRFAALTTAETLLALIVWRRSEFFFLDAYSTDTEIGLYSIAFAAVTALSLIPQVLASTVTPAFATLMGADQWGRIRSGYGRTLRLLTLAMLPVVAAAIALGPATIKVLYGEDYSKAGPVLLVMLVVLPLLPPYNASTALLAGLGRAVAPVLLTVIAAVINIGLDFVLIPRWDAVGAAAASTAAQGLVIVPLAVYATRLVGGVRLELTSLLRATLACVVAGACAWAATAVLGGVAGVLVGLAAGVAIFALLAAALRILPAEDAEWLERHAGSRLGGAVGRGCRLVAQRPSPSVTG
jgi:O-antigen/teichoic acid export membrane protein